MSEAVQSSVPQDPPGNDYGNVTINGDHFWIRFGNRTVIEIKTAGNVPLADDLEQVISGQLTLLPDDGQVLIRGNEVFVSHPKSGSSS